MKKKIKDTVLPISVLTGMIIGVGIFSLPYVTLQVGFPVILLYFLILGTIITIVHLIFGFVCLNTPDFKRMPGFSEFHLGRWGKRISLFFSVFGGLGGLLIYLIIGGSFLKNLFSPFLGGSLFFYTLLYCLFGSFFIFHGMKKISQLSFWALGFLFLVLIGMFRNFYEFIEIENLFLGSIENVGDFFIPYGAVLYSLWGATLIPGVEEMLKRKKHLISEILVASSFLPIVVYLFFIYLVLGLTGPNTSQTALVGLEGHIGANIVNLALILGLLTTFTSYISSGLVLKDIFIFDLKIKKDLSWLVISFVPLAFFLIGADNFIQMVNIVGGIGFGCDGILILLMYKKIKEKKKEKVPSWLIILFLIFGGGLVYELINFFF